MNYIILKVKIVKIFCTYILAFQVKRYYNQFDFIIILAFQEKYIFEFDHKFCSCFKTADWYRFI